MFKQVGKASFAGVFIPGPDVVHYIEDRHGRRCIPVNENTKAIWQLKSFKLYHIIPVTILKVIKTAKVGKNKIAGQLLPSVVQPDFCMEWKELFSVNTLS